MRRAMTGAVSVVTMIALSGAIARAVQPGAQAPATNQSRIERGAQLVRTMGCNDCHTPWKVGPRGPEPDISRALTGHPAELVMPPAPALPPGPWTTVVAGTFTAWAGPWGVSFTANLTPDPETGLGKWTEEMFIATMRTGRHEGKGRPVLPPMPVQMIAALPDEEIKALFAYLQSLPPVSNRVPQPIDPPEGQQ
ncbi:MAG: cytochrome c [Gemmatimonadetes bacterium]|nr:cytochrome c [Gemmatimonadota bacterium]